MKPSVRNKHPNNLLLSATHGSRLTGVASAFKVKLGGVTSELAGRGE